MTNVIGIVIALAVLGGGWWFTTTNDAPDEAMVKDEQVMEAHNDDAMMKQDEGDSMDKMEQEDSMMKKEDDVMIKSDTEDAMMKQDKGDSMDKMEQEDSMMKKDESVSVAPGIFAEYAPEKVASAQGDIVLGFFADWCPSCRVLKADINSSSDQIPAGLTILDVDYDNSQSLKTKYGVTFQHTLVQVDSQGNMINKWSGGNTLDSVLAQIN